MNPNIYSSLFLAQFDLTQTNDFFNQGIGQDILNIIKAVVILVIGWIIAIIVKSIVTGLLKNTQVDNKIASWVTGGGEEARKFPIEDWIGNIAFWIVILFAVIAVLNSLELDAVSTPLNSLLDQIARFVPQIAGAALLLGLAWLLATIAKLIVGNGLRAMRLDERIGEQFQDDELEDRAQTATATTGTAQSNQLNISSTIGDAVYWFIFLLFLPAILSTLKLEGTLGPVQELLNNILGVLPKILGAILIAAAGWFIAQIVRKIVTKLLAASGINRIGANFGLSTTPGGRSLSWIIGTVVYVIILIPTAIEALNTLDIDSISQPGTQMLQDVLTIIPKIFAASVVLIFAYIVAKFVGDFITDILTEIGFNNIFQWLGISRLTRTVSTPEPDIDPNATTTSMSGTYQGVRIVEDSQPGKAARLRQRTPSELVGIIVGVAIMLIASLTAVDILGIQALKTVVAIILFLAGQILLALIILAIGLYISNLAFNFIISSGIRQSRVLAQSARVAILVLTVTMALQELGIAASIVNLAFGLLLGGVAVAIALAFGLGGREVAGEQLREWLNSFKNQ